MDILVAYDVATDTPAGRGRLRKIAQVCVGFGQRVQKSVSECSVNEMQLERLRARLLKVLKKEEDSLRVYRLPQPKERFIETYGLDHYVDFGEPLLV
jgi:CRISPR-associated protein Cas2